MVNLLLSCYSGSAELAAVGVSAAIFNLVSKLFNVPLLNVTTSFVAEEQASVIKAAVNNNQTAEGTLLPGHLYNFVNPFTSFNRIISCSFFLFFHNIVLQTPKARYFFLQYQML